MFFFNQLNKNYFIYFVLIFIFLPVNLLPQFMDAVSIRYAYEINDINILFFWYEIAGRYFHLFFIYLIDILSRYTFISPEFFLDNFLVFFLILFCLEVKRYSKLLFSLNNKWANLAALFTAIFPIWHILVNFDVGQYLISIYFLFFGFRNYICDSKTKILIGLIFILFSFNVESNLSLAVGLGIIFLLSKNKNSKYSINLTKVTFIILLSTSYYITRLIYFPPIEIYEGLNVVTWDIIKENLLSIKIFINIFNFSTFFLFYLLIPIFFFFHLNFINKNKFIISRENIFKKLKNYWLLLLLSGFAIFPYLLVNKSSTLWYATDFYQRHALLLSPIFGLFFSIMFRDLSKFKSYRNQININFYLIIFICISLVILNYGNYRKIEAHMFKKNLVKELKNYGSIPKGDVLLVIEDINKVVAEFRIHELNYLFYKAYNQASWWVVPYHPKAYTKPSKPPPKYLNDSNYSRMFIINEYNYECSSYVYLENQLTTFERVKKFYLLNSEKYYNIEQVINKC